MYNNFTRNHLLSSLVYKFLLRINNCIMISLFYMNEINKQIAYHKKNYPLIFQSIVREPVKFFTAPLTKYLFNYVSKGGQIRCSTCDFFFLIYICISFETLNIIGNLFYFQTLFFSMLVMYSAFVLTSVSTKYYELNIGRVFEYYVYFWGAGDLIEELISCFVRILLNVLGLYVWKHSITKIKVVLKYQTVTFISLFNDKKNQIHLTKAKTNNLMKPFTRSI